MTNYIEEMMRTAGVEATILHYDGCKIESTRDKCNDELDYSCIQCPNAIYSKHYSPFTAEKQLEIIKLIGSDGLLRILHKPISKYWEISAGYLGKYEYGSNIDFTQALAQLTTELMKAGELSKEKVKEILEK